MKSWLSRVTGYIFVVLGPPSVACLAFSLAANSTTQRWLAPEPLTQKPAAPATSAPALPVAAFLVSPAGTAASELLIPFEVFARSGKVWPVIVSPLRQLAPLEAGIALDPDGTLDSQQDPDIVVLPSVADPNNAALLEWVRQVVPKAKLTLVLGRGAELLARAGLVNGVGMAVHFLDVPELQRLAPEAQWITGARYALDGGIVSSPGKAASGDAALYALEKLFGAEIGATVARSMLLPRTPESDPSGQSETPRKTFPWSTSDAWRPDWEGALAWGRLNIAVLVAPRLSEASLGALLETLQQPSPIRLTSVSSKRVLVESRHGLRLVAARGTDSAPRPDLLVIPSARQPTGAPPESDPTAEPAVKAWLRTLTVPARSELREEPGTTLSRSFELLAQLRGVSSASWAARRTLSSWEPPPPHLASKPVTGVVATSALAKMAGLALIGLVLALLVEFRIRYRHAQESE